MERIISTGIFANSDLTPRKIYSKNGGIFYRMKSDDTFTSESDLEEKQYRFNPDDWFVPHRVHIELNGNKYYFGSLMSSYDNGEDYPAGMTGQVVLINPDENNWMTEPAITDVQKTINLITRLLDNNLLTYRNLLFSVEKLSKIVDKEISAYSNLHEFEKQLVINKNKLLTKIDIQVIKSVFDCNQVLFNLNTQFEVGSLTFSNRKYTILAEYIEQHRLLNIFRSYTGPQLLSQEFSVFMPDERPLIYSVDFDTNYSHIINQVMSRYVEMSISNLQLSEQIVKRLDIIVPGDPIVVDDTGTDIPDTETPEDDQPPTGQPATEPKKESGGTLVKLLSFGYLISKFIR